MTALIRWTILAVHHEDGVLILDFMYCLVLSFLRFLRITDWAADSGTLLGTVLAQGANGTHCEERHFGQHIIVPVTSQFFAYSSNVIQDTMLYLSKQGTLVVWVVNSLYLYHNLTRVTVQKIPTRKRVASCQNRGRPTPPLAPFEASQVLLSLPYPFLKFASSFCLSLIPNAICKSSTASHAKSAA